MSYRDKPDDTDRLPAEEYELSDHNDPNDPLLPSYQRHDNGNHSGPYHPRPLSPPVVNLRRKRRSQFKAACFVLVAIFIFLPFVGAFCFRKQINNQLDRVDWDSLPQNIKDIINNWGLNNSAAGEHKHFPTNIGYAGPTPTGKEPGLIATAPAMPHFTNVHPLVAPPAKSEGFSIIQHWGSLSPYHTVKSHGLPESNQLVPEHCELVGMHWLQRHGARYPTSSPGGPAGLAKRLKAAEGWKAKGRLAFLNDWEYKLGAELLTPFGRGQLFNLGVAARVKYGFLLDRFVGHKPVFRTETQDRMLKSAQNFAAGFFGIPVEDQYHLEVMVEAPGFNCTLSPYHGCPNDRKVYGTVREKLAQWDAVFLKAARKRLQEHMEGYKVTLEDAKDMMEMCAYETVALGHSAFCPLFTEKEWRGFQYRYDIYWWYGASFGSPVARAEGLGWMQELTARLTHTPLETFNSTTNSTLHTDRYFPLNDPLYVDFTHDTTFAQLLPTLNLTSFAEAGPPPLDHIPKHWSFFSSKFAPFATNLQVQVLRCGAKQEKEEVQKWWQFGQGEDHHASASASEKRNGDDEGEEGDEGESEDEKTEDPSTTEPSSDASSADEPEQPTPTSPTSTPSDATYVRIILNDAPVPLTGIRGCKRNDDGLCELDAFVSSMHALIGETDFEETCHGDWEQYGEEVVNGRLERR